MSFSIGGEYSFDKLSREHFKLAAKEVGLGEKIALERYDEICESFTPALFDSAGQLETEGYKKATEIAEKIKNSGVTYG